MYTSNLEYLSFYGTNMEIDGSLYLQTTFGKVYGYAISKLDLDSNEFTLLNEV